MKNLTKAFLAAAAWSILGRRGMVRLGRFLSMEGRLDLNGGVDSHGEPLVRRAALKQAMARRAPGARPLRVLDVGARTGEWTTALLETCVEAGFDEVRAHLFEPAAATFERLREGLARHPLAHRLSFERLALSSAPGRAMLHVVHELAGTNSLHAQDELATEKQEEVEVDCLDRWTRERGLESIDLLKIDVEGHDFEVLAGARDLLAERRVGLIQFEYGVRWVYARHFLRDAFELLEPAGYRIGKLSRKGVEFYHGWHPELEGFREVNFVACLPEWVNRFPVVAPWWEET